MPQETLPAALEPASVIEPRVAIAPAASAPIAPYTHSRRFNYSGSVENFTVPPGVTTVNARCWGGGGAGSSKGGGGGFATGDIAVVPGETLRVVVDLGGGPSGGGGMSGLFSQRLGQTLLIAGGGGACALDNPDVRGGAGGGTSGFDARTGSWGGWTGPPAHGASGSTGGAGGAISTNTSYGGRGGNTGQNGGANANGTPGGQVPIPGMGGGGGAGYGGSSGGGAGYAGGGGGLGIGGTAGAFYSGGAGGSSFVNGPGVTGGRTLAGNGTRAGGKDDPLYQSPVGDAESRGQVVLQWTEFTVTPGGPPDVELRQGGRAGYPGVHVESDMAFAPATVTVALPADRGLLFGTQTLADYQLTVQNTDGETAQYTGTLSEDGTSLAFSDVDLELPGTAIMWVAVSAGHDAPLGATSLTFTVGGKPSPSTTIVVAPNFSLSPGGAPVTAERGGPPVYPGVEVQNNGSQAIPLQTVTAVLPADADMGFGTQGSADHQLTVWGADQNITVYVGSISEDGQTLSFSDVDLGIPGDGSQSVMWVCVSASDDTPHGTTSVQFTVGDRVSPSTAIEVV
ncbi:hypothetical protein AQI95_24040 [Streptomyces yokosukanensis]|uniref:Uncharacterized protein n=1 Tax=Streptomyces yokosukanensis TaxID=67386 RepID=A0A101P265_9ACTN|nr:hypothetical protein [Streptomyces yokosukanensis]KUN03556.1 hypothetical protein AQI95_24040 [Streptomyces yokosukanensis]